MVRPALPRRAGKVLREGRRRMNAMTQRRTAAGVAVLMLAALLQYVLLAVSAVPASASHVQPELLIFNGNRTCSQLAGPGQTWIELKVDPNADGVYSDGVLTVTISNTTNDKTFDWTSNIGLDAVLVKAGSTGSYLYRYDPPSEATSDTNLTSPGAANQNGISHISFCYDRDAATTTTTQGTTTTTQGTTTTTQGTTTTTQGTTTTTQGTTTTTQGTTTTTQGTTTTTQGTTTTTQGTTTTTQGTTTTTQGTTTTTQGTTTTTTRPRSSTTLQEITSALGDFIWFDENRNGRQDDPSVEVPIAGATVELLTSAGVVLATQVTGDDGRYLFDDLDAGIYRVRFTFQGAEYTTPRAFGVSNAANSDVDAQGSGVGLTTLINLPPGVTDLTWDAGIVVEVEGIQIETSTTIEPVTVDTLPFTGIRAVQMSLLGALVAVAGALVVFAGRRGDASGGESIAGWSNR